jgi:hypothetical protein
MSVGAGKDSFALNEDAKITFIGDPKGVVVEMSIDGLTTKMSGSSDNR